MTPCSRCPSPAFLRFNASIVYCSECWVSRLAEVTARLQADFNSSSCGDGFTASDRPSSQGEVGRDLADAGVASSPQDSLPASNPRAVDAGAVSASPAAPAIDSDITIPAFLKRGADNVAPYARAS